MPPKKNEMTKLGEGPKGEIEQAGQMPVSKEVLAALQFQHLDSIGNALMKTQFTVGEMIQRRVAIARNENNKPETQLRAMSDVERTIDKAIERATEQEQQIAEHTLDDGTKLKQIRTTENLVRALGSGPIEIDDEENEHELFEEGVPGLKAVEPLGDQAVSGEGVPGEAEPQGPVEDGGPGFEHDADEEPPVPS